MLMRESQDFMFSFSDITALITVTQSSKNVQGSSILVTFENTNFQKTSLPLFQGNKNFFGNLQNEDPNALFFVVIFM